MESLKTKNERDKKEQQNELMIRQEERLLALELQAAEASKRVVVSPRDQLENTKRDSFTSMGRGSASKLAVMPGTPGTTATTVIDTRTPGDSTLGLIADVTSPSPSQPLHQLLQHPSGLSSGNAVGSVQSSVPIGGSMLRPGDAGIGGNKGAVDFNTAKVNHIHESHQRTNRPNGMDTKADHGKIDVVNTSSRDMALSFVKAFVVAQLSGFHVARDRDVRAFLQSCTSDHFPSEDLSPARIKHYVAELYAATKGTFTRDLLRAMVTEPALGSADSSAAPPTLLHATLEVLITGGGEVGVDRSLPTSEVLGNERYVCLRIHWLTPGFEFRDALLAVKRLDAAAASTPSSLLSPSSRLKTSTPLELSSVSSTNAETVCGNSDQQHDALDIASSNGDLLKWAADVLEEYGISTERLFSTVTDVNFPQSVPPGGRLADGDPGAFNQAYRMGFAADAFQSPLIYRCFRGSGFISSLY